MKTWRTKIAGGEFKVMRLNDSAEGLQSESPTLDNPQAVAEYVRGGLPLSVRFNPDVESFIVVFLNTRRRAIGFDVISTGTLDTILIHPREVFKTAIVINAAAIVFCHNHPSGDPGPTEADIKVTRDLIRAGQLLKIEVLDHVILGRATVERPKDYSSLRELGYFYS